MRKLDLKRLFYKNYKIAKHEKIAAQIREKQNSKNYSPLNFDVFNIGLQWFNSGLSLEDADEELRNDSSFIKGYNKGKRLKDIEETLYILGSEYFNDGLSLDELPEIYRKNPVVIRGYKDAENKNKAR